jgi:hypothetical protein
MACPLSDHVTSLLREHKIDVAWHGYAPHEIVEVGNQLKADFSPEYLSRDMLGRAFAMMERHTHPLAAAMDILGFPVPPPKFVMACNFRVDAKLQPYQYAVCLHEIGHAVAEKGYAQSIEAEVAAWDWALDHAIYWDEQCHEMYKIGISSHLQQRGGLAKVASNVRQWAVATTERSETKIPRKGIVLCGRSPVS